MPCYNPICGASMKLGGEVALGPPHMGLGTLGSWVRTLGPMLGVVLWFCPIAPLCGSPLGWWRRIPFSAPY